MLFKRREKFNSLSVRIGIIFSKLPLSPNQWTVLAFVPALISAYFLVKEDFLFSALLFLISGFVDLIDGSVARVTGRVTKLGAYLDTIADRYVEAIIIFALLFVALPQVYFQIYVWLYVYLFGSMLTTYAKAAAKEKDLVDEEIKGGIMERAERMLILVLGIILAAYDKSFLSYTIVLLAVLANISAFQRIYYSIKAAKKSK
ncbi:MAG: CDP-alcohol phosphatidyltransferase family protein [Candidatus Aenigmarchaeota archaeon]|nr:CDP-alcohol phosphatidyltransferase family protein [Candidatus Aenigmarchaeota archaeon]